MLPVNARAALVAAMLAITLIGAVWWRAPLPLNDRGWTAPGALEACWTFDESEGPVAVDSSSHRLDGRLSGVQTCDRNIRQCSERRWGV